MTDPTIVGCTADDDADGTTVLVEAMEVETGAVEDVTCAGSSAVTAVVGCETGTIAVGAAVAKLVEACSEGSDMYSHASSSPESSSELGSG